MKRICLVLFCLLLLTGCSQRVSAPSAISSVTIASTTIQVEVADNDTTRFQGLSDRMSLEKNHGMFFVLGKADIYGFVMRRMNFPLDIIWFNDNKIVDIKTDLPPDNSGYPLIYYPITKADTVLEVPAGTAKENDWKIGDQISFISGTPNGK